MTRRSCSVGWRLILASLAITAFAGCGAPGETEPGAAGNSNGGTPQPAGKTSKRDVSQHKSTIQKLDREFFIIIATQQQKRIQINAKATDEQKAAFKKTFDMVRMSKLKAEFLEKQIWMDNLGVDQTRQLIAATTDVTTWLTEAWACLEYLDAPLVGELTPRLERIESQNKAILESLLKLGE